MEKRASDKKIPIQRKKSLFARAQNTRPRKFCSAPAVARICMRVSLCVCVCVYVYESFRGKE